MENVNKWEDEVLESADHIINVYDGEVKRLDKEYLQDVKEEDREVRHVEHEVAVDAYFAEHHLEYLVKVINREVKKLEKLFLRLEKAENEGNDKETDRLSEKISKRISDSDEHIAKVAEHVNYHINRDAEAAARHVVKGLKKLGIEDDELEEEYNKAADKVIEAVRDSLKKLGVLNEDELN